MLTEAGRAGALTVAITNNPASPLAEVADRTHRHLGARAVPAARRPVGQARPAARPRPALPAGRPGRTSTGPAPSWPPRPGRWPRTGAPAEVRPVHAESRHHDRRRAPRPPWPPTSPAEVRTRLDTDRRAGRRRRPGRRHRPCSTEAIQAGAVIQAFGTGHSEAFAMEIAGRAGGLIPTTKIALRDLVLRGGYDLDALGGSSLERSPTVAEELWAVSTINPGRRLRHRVQLRGERLHRRHRPAGQAARAPGHRGDLAAAHHGRRAQAPERSAAVRRGGRGDRQPGALRRRDADAPADRPGEHPVPVGAVSSITSAFIAQLLTIGVAERIAATGAVPPLYLSANIPGGDEHNSGLEATVRGPDPPRHLAGPTQPHPPDNHPSH